MKKNSTRPPCNSDYRAHLGFYVEWLSCKSELHPIIHYLSIWMIDWTSQLPLPQHNGDAGQVNTVFVVSVMHALWFPIADAFVWGLIELHYSRLLFYDSLSQLESLEELVIGGRNLRQAVQQILHRRLPHLLNLKKLVLADCRLKQLPEWYVNNVAT